MQFTAGFVVVAIPQKVPDPAEPERDELEAGTMLRFQNENPPQGLLGMADAHRDVPPVEDVRYRFVDRGTDQSGKRGFAMLSTVTGRPGFQPWANKAARICENGRSAPSGANAKRRGGRPDASTLPTVTST